ncbi:MAG: outer membrane protein [Gemmatimonadales bacterium]
MRWGAVRVLLPARFVLIAWLTACASVHGPRSIYFDFVRPDQHPPLIVGPPNADSLWGPADSSARGDGIAESRRAGLEELVRRFAPSVVLPKGDYTKVSGRKYRLLPIDARLIADTLRVDRIQAAPYRFHDSLDYALSQMSVDSMARLVTQLRRYEADPDLLVTFYFDFPGGSPREWWRAYAAFRTGPDSSRWAQPTVYAHPFRLPDGRIMIQYWYFYPFNDFIGNHEGDWEHINVVLTPDRSAIAEVHYYFHHRSVNLPQGKFRPRIVDSTHVVAWVGGRMYNVFDYPIRLLGRERNEGSHAHFPFPGEWEGAAGLGAPESVRPAGDSSRVISWDRFRVILMPEAERLDYLRHPEVLKEWAWHVLPVRWGFPAVPSFGWEIRTADVGNRAPFGPAYNAAWNRPAPGILYPAYHLKKIHPIRSVIEDLLQPWYWPYAFRTPRYVHDTRGLLSRDDMVRLGYAPPSGWREFGIGGPVLGVHVAYPTGGFAENYPHSFGFSVWRNFWGKVRFGGLEAMGGYQRFRRSDGLGGTLVVYPFTASAVARMPEATLRPYATLGGGAYGWEARERIDQSIQQVASGWSLGWTGSVGVEYYLRLNLALDVAVRYHHMTRGPGAPAGVPEGPLRFYSLWIGHYLRF